MELQSILEMPVKRLSTLSYNEYCTIMRACVGHQQRLTSMQEREGSATVYAYRKQLLDELAQAHHALTMHQYYPQYEAERTAPLTHRLAA